MIKLLITFLFISVLNFLSSQNAYVELGRKMDFGNITYAPNFYIFESTSYSDEVVYNNHIYTAGIIESSNSTFFPTTNNTHITQPNATYLYLYVSDTLGNPVYSTIHYVAPDLPQYGQKLITKVDNGNVYIAFDSPAGTVMSTNGSTASGSAILYTTFVYFSENTIQNNGSTYDYATILDGSYYDLLKELKVKNNNVYILQQSGSFNKFVSNGSSLQYSFDGYLIKISSTCIANNLPLNQDPNNYGSYFGGAHNETYTDKSFEIDENENVYIALKTDSNDIGTTNGSAILNPSTNNHFVIYKISAYSIANDLPINSGPDDFCTFLPANHSDEVASIKFVNGVLYIYGYIIGDNLNTTGGVNSTASITHTFLMAYSTASMNNNAIQPDYFQIFPSAETFVYDCGIQYYDGFLYLPGQYRGSNIPTTDGSTLNGWADHFICKVDVNTIASNLNWVDNASFLISFGCSGYSEKLTHFEVNELGIHLIYSGCPDPVNFPTNGTGFFTDNESDYYLNYCLNGSLRYSTQYGWSSHGAQFTAGLNNSVYILNLFGDLVQTIPLVAVANQLPYGDVGLVKITFPQPETMVQDSIFPLTQTVCQYGLATILDGENLGNISDSLPDLLYQGTTISQHSSPYFYQWQLSTSPSGPWSNIPNGILEDYLPTVGSQDLYYRRLTYIKSCSDTLVASTSVVASVLVNSDIAPQADAGGTLHTCPGTPVTLGGNPPVTGGTAPYTFSWHNGTSLDANPVFAGNSNVVISLEVTDANGCKDLDQVTVFIHQANAGTDASICNGQSTTIGAYAVQGVPGVSYSWTPATDLSCSDCPFPTVNSTQNQTYTQTLTIPLPDGGVCQTSDQVDVIQVTGPSNPNFAGPDLTICFGNHVQLGTPAEPGFTYNWYPNSYLDNTTTAQPFFTPNNLIFPPVPNPVTYYVIARIDGCEFMDQVAITQIRANAGQDGCGPRTIGTSDVTPNLNETYSWSVVSGPGTITGPTNTPTTTVSGSPGALTVYQLEVSLNGTTCVDQVQVEDCGCTQFKITADSPVGCPSTLLTNDSIRLTAGAGLPNSMYSNLNFSWSPTVGLSSYNTQSVILQTNVPTIYTVTITDPLNASFYCTQQIEVNNPGWALPVFNTIDTILCQVTPISIGSTSVPTYTYSWSDHTGTISTLSNPIVTPQLGVNNYHVIITDVVSECIYNASSQIVVQNFTPSIGDDWYVCENDLVQLSNTAIPFVSYSWDPPNAPWHNGTTNTSPQPIVVVASDVTFTATMTNNYNGCVHTDEMNVFVNQLPQFGTLQNVSICRNESVQIGNPPMNGVEYNWSPAEGLSCTDCAQPFANPTNTTTYQLEMSLAGNCVNAAVYTLQVEVKGATSSLPDINFCPSNGSVNLWPTGPYNFTSYQWEPANLVSVSTIPNPSTSVQSETNFYLTAIDQTGCTVKDTIRVIPTIPTPNAGTDKIICIDEGSVTLGAATNSGSLIWSPATNLTDPFSPITSFTPQQTGTYTFALSQTIDGCTATDSVRVIVNGFYAGSNSSTLICRNSCVPIGTLPQPGVSYTWYPGNGLNSTTISNPIACPAQSTDYTLVATSLNGCTDMYTVSVVVSETEAPEVTIPNISTCSDILSNSVNPTIEPAGNYAYQWTPSIGLSASNIVNPDVYSLSLGTTNYNLTVTDQATGCVGTGSFSLFVNNCEVVPCEVPFEMQSNLDTLCSGENLLVSFSSDSTGVAYSWSVVSNNVQGAINGTGTSINHNLFNSSANLGTVIYTVTPQNANCTGESKEITVYVAPNPIAEIVGYYSVCDGDSVELASLNSAFQYQWSNGSTDSSAYFTLSDNPIQFIVTNEYLCSDTSQVVVLTESNATLFNQIVTICEGEVFEVNGNLYTTSGTYTDVLTSGNGCDSTVFTELIVHPQYTINNPQVICQGEIYQINGNSYNLSGIYTDVLQAINGCDSTVITDLTVNPLPNPLFVGNGEYCIGSSVIVETADSYTSYNWSTGSTNSNINATISDNPITVTVTNSFGCSATSAPFNVNEMTALTYNSTVEICQGDSVTIHGNTETVAGIYSASFPTDSGCDSLSVVTLNILASPVIFAGNDIVVCEGNQVTLNATGGSNYVWTNGIQNNVPFVPVTSGIYTVTSTDADGCVGTDDVLVTVENSEIITFVASVDSGCSPLLVTFTNTSANIGSNCQWILGNSEIVNDCNTATVIYTNPDCYDITLLSTSSAGCTSNYTLDNAVCVFSSPIAEFTPVPTILSSSDPTTTMENNSQNATGYNWSFGDGSGYSLEENPSYTFNQGGSVQYEIMLIAANDFGCVDTAYQIVTVEEDLIFFVPNTFTPDGDEFNNVFKPIFSSGLDFTDFNLKIYNRWGELIFESNNVDIGWDGTYENTTGIVQDGVYVWKLEFKLYKNAKRIIKVGHVTLLR